MSEDIDIPHHDFFTTYAPNYTIEVTPGNVKDENSPEYIREINETYDVLAERITRIVDAL
jgi:histone deacetylase 8